MAEDQWVEECKGYARTGHTDRKHVSRAYGAMWKANPPPL